MRRTLPLLVSLFLSLTLVLTFGCSDDDEGVNQPVVPVEGELSDARFLFADEVFEPDIMRTTEISLTSPFLLLFSLPISSPAADPTTMVPALPDDLTGFVLNSVNTPSISAEGWYVFEYDITAVMDYTDSVYMVGVDSVRLLLAGSPVVWTGAISTTFDARESRDRAIWNSSFGDSGISRHNIDMVGPEGWMAGLLEIDISVVDTVHTSIEDDSGLCYVDLYTTATGTDILITGIQTGMALCADAGTVAVSTVVALDCSEGGLAAGLGVDGLWTLTGTYDSLYVLSSKLTHGGTFWNYADTCTPQFGVGN